MNDRLPNETRAPLEGLETAIVAARAGEITFENLIGLFAETTIVVPSVTDFRDDPQNFQPLTFPFEGGEGFMMGVFTDQDRTDNFDDIAPYATTLTGRQVLGGLQANTGLVVNPGWMLGFQIEPESVPTIVSALDAVLSTEFEKIVTNREPSALEAAIIALESGHGGVTAVLEAFLADKIFVPTRTAPESDMAEVDPLVLDHHGVPHLAAFTGPEFIGDFSEHAEYAMHIDGASMVAALTEGTGVVLNPNRPLTFVLTPEVIAGLAAPEPDPAP